jgi:hypothetical protein
VHVSIESAITKLKGVVNFQRLPFNALLVPNQFSRDHVVSGSITAYTVQSQLSSSSSLESSSSKGLRGASLTSSGPEIELL